jgi:hypothetical protein
MLAPQDQYAAWFAYFDDRERADLYTREFQESLGVDRTTPSVIAHPVSWLGR